MSIWQELKRRRVLQVAATYIVASWVLMQAAALLEETLELPTWFDKVFFAALLLGFPIALLLSWAYEIRPDAPSEGANRPGDRNAFIAILVVLTVGGLAYGFWTLGDVSESENAVALEKSIAVLPFADMSPNSDQAWFADGIAEEILNVLARTEGLKVPSRTASFRYRGQNTDILAAAAEMNVATVLEGSVRSQGSQLRITAQLINAADGFHLWSQTFDTDISDVFAVQEEISVSIANALFGELGVEALPERRFEGTSNMEAYALYLKGLEYLGAFDLRESAEGMELLERAVEFDPEFADAWAALARAERSQGIVGQVRSQNGEALRRALALNPESGPAIAELAQASFGELRWLEAEQLFLRAIRLAPNDAQIRRRHGNFLRSIGRIRASLGEIRIARELGYDTELLISDLVNMHAYLGEYSEARAVFEARVAEVGLENMFGTEAYFVSLLADGMEAEARDFATRDLPESAKARIDFFLGRQDGDPDAPQKLIDSALKRMKEYGRPRWGDIENFLLAGDEVLARQHLPDTQGYGWSIPSRMILHINEQVDPTYLPYRPNLLLLIDLFPGVREAFAEIGVNIAAHGY